MSLAPTAARPFLAAASPRIPLALAMSVTFGALAAVACHLVGLAAIDLGQLALTVLLASAAGAPTTYLAAAVQGYDRDGIPSTKPFLVTVASGALLGAVSQAYVAVRLEAWEQLWLLGVPLGKNRLVWITTGVLFGAIASVAGFVALAIGLRAMRAMPPVLDAEEKLGIPALAIATLGATLVLAGLDPEELVPGSCVVGLGLAALVVLARRDAARRAFVSRVFAGAEPGVEILAVASDADRRTLARVADIPYGEQVLVESRTQGYRTTARGDALMLLGESEDETLAPIASRYRVATRAIAATVALFALRVAALALLHR